MTRADIKAELRRSACEEADPWVTDWSAFRAALGCLNNGEFLQELTTAQMRMFLLLVAEAI